MIPRFDTIRIQALLLLQNSAPLRTRDFRAPLARHFELTDEEINAEYPSGNGNIFSDRISWALSYLFIAGLVEKPQRGVYRITQKGREMLKSSTAEQINQYISDIVQARSVDRPATTAGKKKSADEETTVPPAQTPQELLENSYEKIKRSVYAEILTTILGKKPAEFEKLVVKLLQAKGYGGEVKDSGTVTRQTNDGGIDGMIREDVLGFNRISIQAKRYAPQHNVGREEVQRFVGAVAATPSKKGVFITTSGYSRGAADYVRNLNGNPTIILIDGAQMAQYIYDYGLGMQTEKLLEIKKMDMDFWDQMEDGD